MSNLPEKYKWLLSVKELPKVIAETISLLGTKEIAGSRHNPVIMGMAKALGLEKIYASDEIPWCALMHAYVLTRAGKFIPLKGWDLLRAAKYRAFGVPVPKGQEMLGDTLVFDRKGGGHVGSYIAESANTFHVAGG